MGQGWEDLKHLMCVFGCLLCFYINICVSYIYKSVFTRFVSHIFIKMSSPDMQGNDYGYEKHICKNFDLISKKENDSHRRFFPK